MGKIADLFIKLGLQKDGFDKGLDDAKKKTNDFGGIMQKLGGMIAGAFAVSSIIAFGKELLAIGGQAEGVRTAFNRIADDNILEGLKKSTKGTVTELELMKRAIMASNFGIPVENLASLLEFATKRAQETGQSVDYLVDSIVTGIGRKSPLILDNLGISATQLKEKLHGVGMETASAADVARAVGEIAADSMKKSGAIIETNAIKVAQLETAWMDLKTTIAESGIVTNIFGNTLDLIISKFKIISVDGVSGWKKLLALFSNIPGMDIVLESEALIKKGQEQINKEIDDENKKRELNLKIAEEQAKIIQKQVQEESQKAKAAEAATKAYEKQLEIQRKLKQEVYDSVHSAQSFAPMQTITGGAKVKVRDDYVPEKSNVTPLEGFNQNGLTAFQQQSSDVATSMLSDWDKFAEDFSKLAQSEIIESITAISGAFGELATGEINLKQFFGVILDQFASFLGQLGKMIISMGIAKMAVGTALKNFLSPWGAAALIAAGSGLVAISGAIGSYAKKAGSSGGSVSASSVQTNSSNFVNQNNQTLVARVAGRDLEFVLQRNSTYKTRT